MGKAGDISEFPFGRTVAAVIPLNDPSPVAFVSVFEPGDIWIKVVGCETCRLENRKKCCGECPQIDINRNCALHSGLTLETVKPLRCVVFPAPNETYDWCVQEFVCVKGTNKGKIKRTSVRELIDG